MNGHFCPDLKTCPHPMPEGFFREICNTAKHVNCMHYALKYGTAKRPMHWLQKAAVQASKQHEMQGGQYGSTKGSSSPVRN